MGLAGQFWGGDSDAGYRELLKPSGIELDELRKAPEGIRVPLQTATVNMPKVKIVAGRRGAGLQLRQVGR